jgi:hypothetical protein
MFFINDPEYTKHGYYLANGIKTFSKFEAWQLSGHNINKIKFIFNDDVFSTIDTTKEPKEDIYELYKQRATQLRNEYDYLVLIYSGGIDSHTILETFLENDIHLNEICTFSNNDVESKTSKFNQEVYNAVVPFVETLDLKKLGTRFRFINVGKMIIDQMSDSFHFENFEYYNNILTAWRTAVNSQVLKSKIPEHRKLSEEGKSVCYIWGYDKPTVKMVDQEYFLTIPDAFSGGMGAKHYINNHLATDKFNNFYDEAFYICREFPEISIKQGHMLANLMSTIDSNDSRVKNVWEIPIFGPYVQYKDGTGLTSLWLSKPAVDKCIYPRALMSRFGDDKVYTGSTLFSKKDNWFYKSNHENNTRFNQKMNQLIKENQGLYSFRPKSIANLGGDTFVFGLEPIFSHYYPIRKIPEYI